MADEKAATPNPVREITHTHRRDHDDVNPFLRDSTAPLPNRDENYIVVKQKNGDLHHQARGFQLGIKDRIFNGIATYYEVSKKSYLFRIEFSNVPSEQATMNFNVAVDFSLSVKDPVAIIENGITSMLDCVRHKLKLEVTRVLREQNVRNTAQACAQLQKELTSFECEPYLKWSTPVVTINADDQALAMLRQIEQKRLEIEAIAAQSDSNLAKQASAAMTEKIVQVTVDNLEDHQIAKMAPPGQLFQREIE